MTQLTDAQYWSLSDISYDDSYLEINQIQNLSSKDLKEKSIIKASDGSQWVTINSVNKESGLQGIAVVSMDEYKKLCSGQLTHPENIVFVSRGSEELADWKTNLNELGAYPDPDKILNDKEIEALVRKSANPGMTEMDREAFIFQKIEEYKSSQNNHQFIQYNQFVNDTLKKYKPEDYSFTGHSLGGALAQYMAVLTGSKATTFAAAKAYRLLPPELQKAVREGKFDNLIRDYRHKNDPVGYVPFGEIIGSRIMVKSASSDIWGLGHMGGSFDGMFNNDGSIKLRIDPEQILSVLPKLDHASQNLYFTQEMVITITETLDSEIQKVYHDFMSQMGSGEFSHLNSNDVRDIFEDIAQSKESSHFYFYDRELKEQIMSDLEEHKQGINKIKDEIGTDATQFVETDFELSKLFGGLS